MNVKQDFSGQYSPKPGKLLTCAGSRTSSIILTLKGKIDVLLSPNACSGDNEALIVSKSCRLFTLDRNTFLGVNDILRDCKSSLSLKADEGCTVFCFSATSPEDLKSILSTQKDYSAYLVTSLATLIDISYDAYQKLNPLSHNINKIIRYLSLYYWAIKDKYNFRNPCDADFLKTSKASFEELKNKGYTFFPVDPDNLCADLDQSDEDALLDTADTEYFSSLLNVPMDHRKGFFNSDNNVCLYHIRKGSDILDAIIFAIKGILTELDKGIATLCLSSSGLIPVYGRIAIELKEDREAALELLKILTIAISETSQCLHKVQKDFDFLKHINAQDLSDILSNVQEKASIDLSHPEVANSSLELPDELNNSLVSILNYSSCTQDAIDNMNRMLCTFKSIKDKTSLNTEERALRESITTEFFKVYEKAFKRSQLDHGCPRLISMFLNFGFMDERLVTRDQTLALYRLCDKENNCSDFSIYSSKQWLEQIYQNKKDPSINEFGQDYSDIFREMKKQRMVSEADKAKYDNDFEAKLDFEITNMLKSNQKVCHGHMSTYFPILHKDMITRDLEKAVVTPARIEKILNHILSTDYSAFYRELWYRNDVKGIEKELIMKEVRPDIIIIPTFGSRVSMWQEIAGRNRSAPGRFMLPAFTDEDLDKLILKLLGAFRWELCRTMAGVAWNDITEKSLTSEYTDLIQFYKSNSELSEEAKEKIKNQIQKNRSMMREIFTGDYENWINYEAKGNQKLNKIVRSIMMRYCPPSKEIRNMLARHPAFSDLVTHVNVLKEKTAKSLTSRYTKLFKNGPMDRDMELNLMFYRDL